MCRGVCGPRKKFLIRQSCRLLQGKHLQCQAHNPVRYTLDPRQEPARAVPVFQDSTDQSASCWLSRGSGPLLNRFVGPKQPSLSWDPLSPRRGSRRLKLSPKFPAGLLHFRSLLPPPHLQSQPDPTLHALLQPTLFNPPAHALFPLKHIPRPTRFIFDFFSQSLFFAHSWPRDNLLSLSPDCHSKAHCASRHHDTLYIPATRPISQNACSQHPRSGLRRRPRVLPGRRGHLVQHQHSVPYGHRHSDPVQPGQPRVPALHPATHHVKHADHVEHVEQVEHVEHLY